MLTYKNRQLRRIQTLWPETRTASAVFLIETWAPRLTYTVPSYSVKATGGIDEVLRVARLEGGQILEQGV